MSYCKVTVIIQDEEQWYEECFSVEAESFYDAVGAIEKALDIYDI